VNSRETRRRWIDGLQRRVPGVSKNSAPFGKARYFRKSDGARRG
jgi:hypothetical protein